ncbi:hypothetical protein HG537_0H03280 [Torulaspora globosa]|uniref:Rho termination factor N-terminal domain-containing protein n=1 Tax=Torulaspora globosa TaxID=48254 RepID=A0A7H9I105_9SACH|nr:hypothetical protein HG537_0H03280 [Torulaspora sp. CBS 2947]
MLVDVTRGGTCYPEWWCEVVSPGRESFSVRSRACVFKGTGMRRVAVWYRRVIDQMSSFNRWKKVELLDLADKLKLNVANSIRKNELIAIIEDHLNVLSEPLDVEVDYPELKSFYDAIVVKHETDEATASEEEPVEETVLDGFSKVDFSEQSDEDSTFKFAFEEYLSDVAARVRSANESLQDSLSTIQAVDALFYAIEFYHVVRPLVARQDARLSSSALVTWVLFSIGIPLVAGYYVNFIRYDLPDVQVDPMVFHLAKFLVGLGILNVELDSSGSEWQVFFKLGLTAWVNHLGQLPLIFGLVGALLTVYIF